MAKNFYPVTSDAAHADVVTTGAVSTQFTNIAAMASGEFYVFVCAQDCWIKQSANPTASAAAGSMFVPAKILIHIDGAVGAKLAVIQDSVAGKASLTRVKAI